MKMRCLHPGAAVWGDRDHETDLMPIYAGHGLLFTMDMRSGRCFQPGEEVCYFIGPKDGSHVKIGKSTDVTKRLRALQLSSPQRLSLLAVTRGGGEQEVAYHRRFAEDRAWGEWFWRSPTILREMKRLQRSLTRTEADAEPDVEFEIHGIDDVRKIAA